MKPKLGTNNHTSQHPTLGTLEPGQILEFDPAAALLHYYNPHQPHRPALCGELPASEDGWAQQQATNSPWGISLPLEPLPICPACQAIYATIPTRSTEQEGN